MSLQPEYFYDYSMGSKSWAHGNVLPGTYTTKETPADGFFAEGSVIPPGVFVALAPRNFSATSGNYQSVILPDRLGTSLTKLDGTDYSDIIADALDANDNPVLAGVSVGHRCPNDCEIHWGVKPCPPHHYKGEGRLAWKFFRPTRLNQNTADSVSAVHNDDVYVYAETDFKPGDAIHVRVEITVPFVPGAGAVGSQVFGGITNVSDAGTIPITSTRFANAQIVRIGGKAGNGAWVNLG